MKKTILAVLVLAAVACGGKSKSEGTTPPPNTPGAADAGTTVVPSKPAAVLGNPCGGPVATGSAAPAGNPCGK